MSISEIQTDGHYWVSGLRGLTNCDPSDSTTLRCKILRIAGEFDVIIMTTDIRNVGTKLAVSPAQIERVATW